MDCHEPLQAIDVMEPVSNGDQLSHVADRPSIVDALCANTQELAAMRAVLTELVDMAKRHPFLSKFLMHKGGQ